jgi:hydrogenase maturation protease
MSRGRHALGIVGVGNTLAGDDGAGIEVIRRLKEMPGIESGVFLHTLEGDHFEIADYLDQADRFIFVDAVEGERPGELVSPDGACRAFAPSFHQSDITAVMHCLQALGSCSTFPSWELWGISILPPTELGEGLSLEVEKAVERMVERLCREIRTRVETWEQWREKCCDFHEAL